jgi:hypothetical protein
LKAFRGKGITLRGSNKRAAFGEGREITVEASEDFTKELEWIRMSPKGRQTKRKPVKFWPTTCRPKTKQQEEVELYIPAGPRLCNKVIIAEGVKWAFGDRSF